MFREGESGVVDLARRGRLPDLMGENRGSRRDAGRIESDKDELRVGDSLGWLLGVGVGGS